MIELVAPSFTQPSKLVRLYYVTPAADALATDLLTKTVRRFVTGTTAKNVAVDDDIDWKMQLSEYMIKEQSTRKTARPGLKTAPACTIWFWGITLQNYAQRCKTTRCGRRTRYPKTASCSYS